MRLAVAVIAIICAAWPLNAMAYENFIPLGHNYSPDDPSLPALNSDQDKVNAQVDIFESEIYVKQRRAKEFSSRLDRFYYSQELSGANNFIDY